MADSLDDSTWVARCIARLVELDPALDPELARPVAEDMCGRQRWRDMAPEQAAQVVFDLDMRSGAVGAGRRANARSAE